MDTRKFQTKFAYHLTGVRHWLEATVLAHSAERTQGPLRELARLPRALPGALSTRRSCSCSCCAFRPLSRGLRRVSTSAAAPSLQTCKPPNRRHPAYARLLEFLQREGALSAAREAASGFSPPAAGGPVGPDAAGAATNAGAA